MGCEEVNGIRAACGVRDGEHPLTFISGRQGY